MSKQTILIMTFGLLIILSLSFFSFNYFDTSKIKKSSSSLSEAIDINSFKMDYSDVLEKIGGGSFKNEEVQVSLDKEWILNTESPQNNNPADVDSKVFLNAYQIEEDTAVPWFFIISEKETFDIPVFLEKIAENNGKIISKNENGSLSIEYENGTSQKTIIIQMTVKTTEEKFLTFSLITVNASPEKAEEKFNGILAKTSVVNYLEVVDFSLEEEKEEVEE